MVGRCFVDQASVVLEANLSGNIQRMGELLWATVHTTRRAQTDDDYTVIYYANWSSLSNSSPSLPFFPTFNHSVSALIVVAELQRPSIPGFFTGLQEDGVCDLYFSYQGCQIDINSPTSSVNCPKATLVISYTKPVAFKVGCSQGTSSQEETCTIPVVTYSAKGMRQLCGDSLGRACSPDEHSLGMAEVMQFIFSPAVGGGATTGGGWHSNQTA